MAPCAFTRSALAICLAGTIGFVWKTAGLLAAPDGKPLAGGAGTVSASQFLGLSDFSGWTWAKGERDGEEILTSPEIDAPRLWDELVVSWNSRAAKETSLKIEARALFPPRDGDSPGPASKYYVMGLWSPDAAVNPRESVKAQKDEDGDVETDTLVLKRPAKSVQLRVTFSAPVSAERPEPPPLQLIGLSFFNRKADKAALPPNRSAWGKLLAVPERSQVAYPGGEGWCSPTSTSMVLSYWARSRNRADLERDVPEVAKGVFDKNWPGTGNWPFNTAYAGSFPDMRAYVTRFDDISELEDWIAAGVPVVCSVSYKLLKGQEKAEAGGHIVVCVGFTPEGDVIVNDPWARLDKGEKVRKTFPRKNMVAGWGKSRNTVYLIYPQDTLIPEDRRGHWERRLDAR